MTEKKGCFFCVLSFWKTAKFSNGLRQHLYAEDKVARWWVKKKRKKKAADRFWLEVPGEMTRWWGIQSGSGWENLWGGQLNGRRGSVRLLIGNWWAIVKLCASTKQDSVLSHHAGHTQILENISRHQESWVQVTVSVSELFSPFAFLFFPFFLEMLC